MPGIIETERFDDSWQCPAHSAHASARWYTLANAGTVRISGFRPFRPSAHWHSHVHAYMRGIFLFSIF